jgi:hypothetical protein
MTSREKFAAESKGPPHRRLRIEQDPPVPPNSPPTYISGWRLFVDEIEIDGTERQAWDWWEETIERALIHVLDYAPSDIAWRRVSTGEIVDVYTLKL